MDELKLIERLKNGEEKAFKEFFEYYYKRVFNYAYRKVKMREIAEDITSETFLKFIRSLNNFELKQGYHLDTWIYAIERNIIRDWFRKNFGKEILPLEEEFNQKYETLLEDPYETFANEYVNETVKRAIDLLPETYRKVLVMRFYEGRSIKEIADLLQKTEDNIKVIQFRALKRLREIIEEMIKNE